MTIPKLETGSQRRHDAKARRAAAADRSGALPVLNPTDNSDERLYPKGQPANFTKGLKHDDFGLADGADYDVFRRALIEGMPDMGGLAIAAGTDQRKWESPLAGLYYNDIGADPDAIAMAPAPKLGRSELCAEMASVYAMALTRDMSFEDLQDPTALIPGITTNGSEVTVQDLVDELNKLSWFDPKGAPVGYKGKILTMHEKRRRAAAWASTEDGLTVDVLFRGSAPGAKQGPYLSQFMLLGTNDRSAVGGKGGDPLDGKISYGLQSINQAQLVPNPGEDYMTTWDSWLEVQQGTRYDDPAHPVTRRIHTPRDLAGYVHFDALYQAYLNACLILLDAKANVDMNNPIDTQRPGNTMGFATWGDPHILSLVTEVATRALRAARRTKFQVHRRARPEVIAARLAQVASGHDTGMDPQAKKQIQSMLRELGFDTANSVVRPGSILDWVQQRNLSVNGPHATAPLHDDKNFLLPMAFVEGSPMHPAYGAGHATVAGACVTILKAFFESQSNFGEVIATGDTFYAADALGGLQLSNRQGSPDTTLADELDKLAANISIGRNMAGVHYYSDYYDSLRMGERIAVSMLEEQMFTYNEKVAMVFTTFDGDVVTIGTDGGMSSGSVTTQIADASGNPVHRDTWWTRDIVEYGIAEDPNSGLA